MMFSLNRILARPGIRSFTRTLFRHRYIFTPTCEKRWPKGEAKCPSWFLDNNKKGVATNLRMDLPYISHAFQRTLACSLYYLLKQNSVESFLWGDLLHGLLTRYSALPHEFSYIVAKNDLVHAHDVLQNVGFKRCQWDACYLRAKFSDAPAIHYHFEIPSVLSLSSTLFRSEWVERESDKGFEELETVRIYRKEDTLWEIDDFEIRGPAYNAMYASDRILNGAEWREECENKYQGAWPNIRIPTPQRYTEALILNWIRHSGTKREMYWFFKLFDMCNAFYDNYYGHEVIDRMDDHLRGILISFIRICDFDCDELMEPDDEAAEFQKLLAGAYKTLYRRAFQLSRNFSDP